MITEVGGWEKRSCLNICNSHKIWNNGKFLSQSLFPLRHPKKNCRVTLCQLSSMLDQEPVLPTKSILNVGGLAVGL